MEVTLKVNRAHRDRVPGRIEIRADEESLTPHAGLAITGQLVGRLGVTRLIDAELAQVRTAAPVKVRDRGISAGELLISLAESQLTGAECFADCEELRADSAGTAYRAVAEAPSAATALQLAKRFRRSHVWAAERAMARAGAALDRSLGRDPTEDVTIDLDATQLEVFGRKRGAKRSRHGCLAYAPHVAFWAERGRALSAELVGGNQELLAARESARIARRAISLLPAGHGEVTFRIDSAYYAVEPLEALRAEGARFTVSVPRTSAMWSALGRIAEDAWEEAQEMDGAEVAETTYRPSGWEGEELRLVVRRVRFSASQIASASSRRRRTIHPDQLALLVSGEASHCYGYSFILTDLPAERSAASVEHSHRHRAQVEERIGEAKLGQALRRMPSADENANRVWMHAALTALNLAAMTCDLCPEAGASGKAPRSAPLRRAQKTLRRLLFRVPARIVRSGRQTVLRLPAGFRGAEAFRKTYEAADALGP